MGTKIWQVLKMMQGAMVATEAHNLVCVVSSILTSAILYLDPPRLSVI